MGKINGCLKCIFIFFNMLFLLQGCGLVFLVAKLHLICFAYNIQLSALGMPGIGWFWLFALGVLGVSALGIFAACCEKNLALKIFAGLMGIGMIVMTIVGIQVVVKRNEGRSGPTKIYSMACGEHVFWFLDYIFRIFMAFFFAYAITALLGLLITIWMIRQVSRNSADESIAMEDK